MAANSSIQYPLWQRLLHLVLYSNLWIAGCAAAITWLSVWLFEGDMSQWLLPAFVACSTLALYAIHRLVGLQKVDWQNEPLRSRYYIISQYRTHIIAYAFGASLLGCYLLWQLPLNIWWAVPVPAILSLGYALPIWKGLRLRDLPYIKILLIAIVWAWVTVALPALYVGVSLYDPSVYLLFAERMLFIYAITIPFDIRDLQIDAYNQVHTIPGRWGIVRAQQSAYAALLLATGIACFQPAYSPAVCFAVVVSYSFSSLLVARTTRFRQSDYFFTAGVDGLMGLQVLLVVLFDRLL